MAAKLSFQSNLEFTGADQHPPGTGAPPPPLPDPAGSIPAYHS